MLTPCHIPFLPVVVVILMAAPVWGALYPYGAAWGDQSPPNKRWEAYRMYFGGRQLVFMGVTTDQLRVTTTGEVKYQNAIFKTFGNPEETFDFAANSQSAMYYRISTDTTLLSELKEELERVFNDRVTLSHALVVTWVDVTMRGGDDTTPVNTIQAVVAIGALQTFLIINYEDINWFGWDAFSSRPVKTFGRVETTRFGTSAKYYLPGAGQSDMDEQLKLGNSGTPSRWMLRIDISEISIAVPQGMCLASHYDSNSTRCFCYDKFRGSLCHIDIEAINECASNPCVRGTCEDLYDAFKCTCPPMSGYVGDRCEIELTPGYFGLWGEWGECSKTCDRGFRTRVRECLREPCLQPNTQRDNCVLILCAENVDQLAHSVSIRVRKSMLEVVQDEENLKEHIATAVNAYCFRNMAKCCAALANVEFGLFFRQFATSAHVKIVNGYPATASSDIRQIEIRVVVQMTSAELRSGCVGTFPVRRKKRHLDTDLVMHFHDDLLKEAIRKHREDFNNEMNLCCYNVEDDIIEVPGEFWGVLLGSMIPIGGATLAVIGYLFYYISTIIRKKPSAAKVTSSSAKKTTKTNEETEETETADAQGMTSSGHLPVRLHPAYVWNTAL